MTSRAMLVRRHNKYGLRAGRKVGRATRAGQRCASSALAFLVLPRCPSAPELCLNISACVDIGPVQIGMPQPTPDNGYIRSGGYHSNNNCMSKRMRSDVLSLKKQKVL